MSEPSPGWQRVTGQSWQEFRDDGWIDAVHPDDRASVIERWSRALREVQPRFTHTYRLRLATGGYRHFAVDAAPVRDGDTVIEWIGTCRDVEQEWQDARRERLLARATAVTADTARPDEMLAALTAVIVPELADSCTSYLLPQALHRTPGTALTAERVAAVTRQGPAVPPPHHAEHLGPDSALVRAADLRRPVHAVFPPGSPPPDIAPPGSEPWLAPDANSVVLLPVVVDGTTAALVVACVSGDRPSLGQPEISLLQTLLERAHTPLSNALEYQRTRQVALALQHSLLTEPPDVPGLDIAVRYRPSNSAAEVGGDWYDSFVLRDGATVLTVGDVAGHDLPAAVTMGQLRNMLRGLTLDREEPTGDILRRLDASIQTLYLECTATPASWPGSNARRQAACSSTTPWQDTPRRCSSRRTAQHTSWTRAAPRCSACSPTPATALPSTLCPPVPRCCCTPTGWSNAGTKTSPTDWTGCAATPQPRPGAHWHPSATNCSPEC